MKEFRVVIEQGGEEIVGICHDYDTIMNLMDLIVRHFPDTKVTVSEKTKEDS